MGRQCRSRLEIDVVRSEERSEGGSHRVREGNICERG